MWLLTLFSAGLFVLPAAITVGGYIGIEYQKVFHGEGRPAPGTNNPLGPGPDGDGRIIETNTWCQKSFGITPFPGRYVFNPNQWGDPDDLGDLCMNITTDSGVSEDTLFAAGFSATWQYPVGPVDEPVHAFPNAKLLLPGDGPVRLAGLDGLRLDVSWSYGLGSYVHADTDSAVLGAAKVNANVCVDMFLAADAADAADPTRARYEVMVWLAAWGDATDPIGLPAGSQANHTINGTRFDLYYGDNALGQTVLTWLADRNTTDFIGDIGPLIHELKHHTGPDASDHLGYVAFGSEALYSFENVTFYVPRLAMDIDSS
ncbi:concanavalin A-like lectin/glucanase domain-containing protein [Lineolata rhizophorae]|uniref:Concanavalin A-like lectin/glucanase domain-containing protein n=1 Tax=Lineolata rhizophorae TaxID=578093 RepID=A0A6A6P5C7_9PEZI|nr:concanavalin A-like lectin/glucanase domain-containing protein [Lineolata rhizophorae]